VINDNNYILRTLCVLYLYVFVIISTVVNFNGTKNMIKLQSKFTILLTLQNVVKLQNYVPN